MTPYHTWSAAITTISLAVVCFLLAFCKPLDEPEVIAPEPIPTYEPVYNEVTERVVFYAPNTETETTLEVTKITPPTLYDSFTEREINLLEVTIQHEVGAFSDEYKTLIAELIYNRLVSDQFPNTVEAVLFQNNQFCGIEYWYSPDFEIDESTKEIVRKVFSKNETSHEALYYYNPELSDYNSVMWFEYSGDVQFLFEHTETDWGIEYTTRFFK